MKVLVCGGLGFQGKNIIEHFLNRGDGSLQGGQEWIRIKTSIWMLVFGLSLLIYLFCWFAY